MSNHPDHKLSPDASNGLNQSPTLLEKKKSRLDNDLNDIRTLVRLCQMVDTREDETERSYTILLHDILIEKLDKAETLVGQL